MTEKKKAITIQEQIRLFKNKDNSDLVLGVVNRLMDSIKDDDTPIQNLSNVVGILKNIMEECKEINRRYKEMTDES